MAVIEFNTQARRAIIGGTTNYQVVDDAYVADFANYIAQDGNGSESATEYDPEDYCCSFWCNECQTNWQAAFLLVQSINIGSPPASGLANLIIFFYRWLPDTAFWERVKCSNNSSQWSKSTRLTYLRSRASRTQYIKY